MKSRQDSRALIKARREKNARDLAVAKEKHVLRATQMGKIPAVELIGRLFDAVDQDHSGFVTPLWFRFLAGATRAYELH